MKRFLADLAWVALWTLYLVVFLKLDAISRAVAHRFRPDADITRRPRGAHAEVHITRAGRIFVAGVRDLRGADRSRADRMIAELRAAGWTIDTDDWPAPWETAAH